MVIKLIVLVAMSTGSLPTVSPATHKIDIAEDGDLNPQPLPPWTGEGTIQEIT